MERLAKLAVMLGIVSMTLGTLGFLLPNNSFFQFLLLLGFLLTLPGWSFSSEDFRRKVKIFLSEHWFGKYVGYILIVLAVICIFIGLLMSRRDF